MTTINKPTLLMILDGYGISDSDYGNAIKAASTPNLDSLFKKYPNILLGCSGRCVGLPEGQMGNSEVGHLNIGAGRIVFQDFTRITDSIDNKTFFNNKSLKEAFKNSKDNNSNLHIMGLLSDGGVHSHESHLHSLLYFAKKEAITKIELHLFLDGRDVPPRSALSYLDRLEEIIANYQMTDQVKIASIMGRYYAMDRDKRWDRVEKAYDAMTLSKGLQSKSAKDAINEGYERGENDEFILPTVIKNSTPIAENDSVIFFNFRPDRAREITRALVDPKFQGFSRKKQIAKLNFTCMTQYDATMPNVQVAYPPVKLTNTLGEYISAHNLKQLRLAETEKYAHVTFFFNGGVEKENPGEDRILVPSPDVATYDLKPEMSAYEVTKEAIKAIEEKKYDLIILNFANLDMVGHSGNMEAAIKAVEVVDKCVGQIIDTLLKHNGQALLTADHGNSETMLAVDGSCLTAHSTNPVPLILIKDNPQKLKAGALPDLAPTILDMMGLKKPVEMTGNSLLIK